MSKQAVEVTDCPRCEKRPAAGPHRCPYQADVNDDEEFECECCEMCQEECAGDI